MNIAQFLFLRPLPLRERGAGGCQFAPSAPVWATAGIDLPSLMTETDVQHRYYTSPPGKSAPMHLARFPRVKLCHAPTPLEFMPNLTKHLGGPQLWIKRD